MNMVGSPDMAQIQHQLDEVVQYQRGLTTQNGLQQMIQSLESRLQNIENYTQSIGTELGSQMRALVAQVAEQRDERSRTGNDSVRNPISRLRYVADWLFYFRRCWNALSLAPGPATHVKVEALVMTRSTTRTDNCKLALGM
jgi:hypothetical protein